MFLSATDRKDGSELNLWAGNRQLSISKGSIVEIKKIVYQANLRFNKSIKAHVNDEVSFWLIKWFFGIVDPNFRKTHLKNKYQPYLHKDELANKRISFK